MIPLGSNAITNDGSFCTQETPQAHASVVVNIPGMLLCDCILARCQFPNIMRFVPLSDPNYHLTFVNSAL